MNFIYGVFKDSETVSYDEFINFAKLDIENRKQEVNMYHVSDVVYFENELEGTKMLSINYQRMKKNRWERF